MRIMPDVVVLRVQISRTDGNWLGWMLQTTLPCRVFIRPHSPTFAIYAAVTDVSLTLKAHRPPDSRSGSQDCTFRTQDCSTERRRYTEMKL